MKQIGLICAVVGGGFAVFGGLFALIVFVAGGDTTSKGVVGALGLYFLGKGMAVAGLGLISYFHAPQTGFRGAPIAA